MTGDTWLRGWYDPCLIDIWEEFISSWSDEPVFDRAFVFFAPGYYSRLDAQNLVLEQYLVSRPAFCTIK
jgi:hypothetical protein